MKNSTPFITPLYNIERNSVFVMLVALLSIVLIFVNYKLFVAMHPLGFFLIVPMAFVTFQSIWFLLHPFALVYKEKIIVRLWLFSTKEWHFIDVAKINLNQKNELFVTYKDGEIVKLNLLGIKKSEINSLKKLFEENISST